MVLKIIKHCQEEGSGGNELVQGVLLGLVENNRLEVTNCFPFPRHTEEEDLDEGRLSSFCKRLAILLEQIFYGDKYCQPKLWKFANLAKNLYT